MCVLGTYIIPYSDQKSWQVEINPTQRKSFTLLLRSYILFLGAVAGTLELPVLPAINRAVQIRCSGNAEG